MKNSLITFVTIFIFVLAAGAFAQAPSTMPYQGRLADDAGNAITGAVNDVVFTIYDDTTAGANDLWAETDTLNCDENGVFTIELGLEVPIDPMIFNGEKRWLGIKVGTDDEMVPRQLLSSVPYAFSTLGSGVAYKEVLPANTFIDFPGSDAVSLDSIKIDVPAAGYVNVTGLVSYKLNHSGVTAVYSQIQDQEAYIQYSQYGTGLLFLTSAAGLYYIPVTINKVFQVATPGVKTYYFNTIFPNGYDTNDDYFDLQLTAVYYPSSYGAISVSKSAPLKSSGNAGSPETPGGIVPTE